VADSTWSRVGEINYVAKAAQQRRIKMTLHADREDSWAMVHFHALQEVMYLTIGVSVMAVLNLAPADKQGVSLIEEEDVSAILGYIEDSSQILFRLCNVLTDDC
jgi:arginine repressor